MSVYAVSDLHGHLELYKEIKKFLNPKDKVICLGDCGDRGPQPWKTIKAVAADPQWEYLMGNHEHMLAGAMCEYLDDDRVNKFYQQYPDCCESMQALVAYNGGGITMNEWVYDGANPGWINYLIHLPSFERYINNKGNEIYLTHAGYTPKDVAVDKFNLLWSRNHFFDEWPKGFDNTIIVHGHTPCQFFDGVWTPEFGAIWYAENHKINIDMGTEDSKEALLLDLDTFDEHIFKL